jgi:NO-binding membrane sensor protein with MHYT domain
MSALQNFFVSAPANNLLYEGFHDPVLVGFSVVVAVLSAYASLLVSQHVVSTQTRMVRRIWVAAGGLCLGSGIWAMHFIGMLAFSLPCATAYDTTLTVLSTVPGILASMLAVNTISRKQLTTGQLLWGGLLIGAGVGTMHYAGMAAMRINGLIRYDATLFFLSIVVAVVLAICALWIKFRLQASARLGTLWTHLLSASVLGLALSGMHYTAMLAAYFVRDDATVVDTGLQPSFLAMIVILLLVMLILSCIF